MKKLNNFFSTFFIFLIISTINAQTVVFNESLATYDSFNTFTSVSVTGQQSWHCNIQYGYSLMNGFANGQSNENEDWLITPEINLENYNNLHFSFDHTRGPVQVVNVGTAQGWYKVFATTNYTGNVTTTQWTELVGINHNVSGAWQWISSGELVVPEAVKSATTRFAFRYVCNNTESATWQVKNVKITGSVNPNDDNVFKITTWNVEHFGSLCDGPTNENLQMNNVAEAILAMNPDVICLQEVTQSNAYPTIASLVAILGNDEWAGNIVASDPTNCSQNQGIIYKKSKVQFVSSSLLSNGAPSQGNSYYHNWSNGRYPALYNINLIVGSELVPVSLVNIHAKSSSDQNSYIRRKGASEALKTILDGSQYNTRNILVLGDFNDYINTTICSQCTTNDSPYKNFLDDSVNYMIPTQNLQNNGCNFSPYVINNMIISNEVFDNYISNSVEQELTLINTILNYCETTSDHLPVSALFEFTSTSTVEDFYAENSVKVYPNPVIDVLNVDILNLADNQLVEIYDLTGKKILNKKLTGNTIDVNSLLSGIYILKIGSYKTKFIKN